MKISFLGAAHEVTGSCTLIEVNDKKLLVDFGMEQGPDIYENCDMPISPYDIDSVFLTHAHIDHSGKLPLLTKNGFRGRVYSTRATRDLCSIMLADSAHIQETEAIFKNRRAKRSGEEEYTPLYTIADVEDVMKCFTVTDYDREITVCEGVSAKFIDAGHLLGSSSIILTLKEGDKVKKLLFSGDIGTYGRPLLSDPTFPTEADYVVIESTYGDKNRPTVTEGYEKQLAEIIDRTVKDGGNVVIPSFAVGRTQELLYTIRRIKEQKLTRCDFPVWLDSPLAIEATKIFSGTLDEYYDDETKQLIAKNIDPVTFKGLHLSVTADDSKKLNLDPTPKVIISASGMCEAGRIKHHLKYNLWRPESTVLFVGYQVAGTLGRRILDGEPYVNLFGEEIKVRASIERIESISGHADREMLIKWLSSLITPPQAVFVNHGDDEVCDGFAEYVNARLGVNALAPYNGQTYDLLLGKFINEGNTAKIKKRSQKKNQESSLGRSKLYSSGTRLMSLIERSGKLKKKEMIAFTDRINAVCDKLEKAIRDKRR